MGANSEMYIAIQEELFNVVNKAEEGELTYLDSLIKLREHRDNCESILAIIKEFEDDKINEIEHQSSQYPDGYLGYEIKKVNGRKTFSFKNIPEWEAVDSEKKKVEDKYKTMFEAKMKGVTGADIDVETGEVLPLPEISYSKSYITLKKKKGR